MASTETIVAEVTRQVRAENAHLQNMPSEAVSTAIERIVTLGLMEGLDDPSLFKADEYGDTPFQKYVVLVGTQVVMGLLTPDMIDAYKRGQKEGNATVRLT